MNIAMMKTISKYHDNLARAMKAFRDDDEVTQADVRTAYSVSFPECPDDLQWIMPADHCFNHRNDGSCECVESERAIFDRLGHNRYKVRRN